MGKSVKEKRGGKPSSGLSARADGAAPGASPEAAAEPVEPLERARLQAEVARQRVRIAKEELKRARKRVKEAKREAKRARKQAAAARKLWKRARKAAHRANSRAEGSAAEASSGNASSGKVRARRRRPHPQSTKVSRGPKPKHKAAHRRQIAAKAPKSEKIADRADLTEAPQTQANGNVPVTQLSET